jgi:hypothetical protein
MCIVKTKVVKVPFSEFCGSPISQCLFDIKALNVYRFDESEYSVLIVFVSQFSSTLFRFVLVDFVGFVSFR